MRDLGQALGRLDDESRALLELSLRRGMSDEEIAAILLTETDEIEHRRSEFLERLASDLELDGHLERDELFATLQDLPQQFWHGGR
jgi:DNA-directed RNA polymerase specialized sigma24 family protein